MSRNWLLVGAGICVVASTVSAYLAHRPVGGLIAVAPVQNLGRVPQGATIPVAFELVNRSWEPVELLRVLSGCSCAVGELPVNTLEPGERCKLEVSLRTGPRRGAVASDLAVVYRQGEAEQALRLHLAAEVQPDYVWEPASLTFQGGQKEVKVLRVSPERVRDVEVKRVVAAHSGLEARIVPGSRAIEVSFDPALWTSETEVEVRVETNSENQPWFRVPVVVE